MIKEECDSIFSSMAREVYDSYANIYNELEDDFQKLNKIIKIIKGIYI